MILNSNKYKIVFIFLSVFTDQIFTKRVVVNNSGLKFKNISLSDLIAQGANINVQKCFEDYYFEVEPFPLSLKYPYKGYFKQPYILSIPEGKTGKEGNVFLGNYVIKDLFRYGDRLITKNNNQKVIHKQGRLADIEQIASDNYFHWTNEVLGRLALLEMHGIEYDKLYVSISKRYQKEFLIDIWGIDPNKIIEIKDPNIFIQADMLIVPSMIYDLAVLFSDSEHHAGHYTHPLITKYVREKILANLNKKINFGDYSFHKRVFISRKDAPFRKIINEDDLFKILETRGFKSYVLGQLSVVEQISLFHNAEVVVAEHGAGLTNILFCKPKTKIVEIFQALIPVDYWWISSIYDLDYRAINTMNVNADLFESAIGHQLNQKTINARSNISLDTIKNFFETF